MNPTTDTVDRVFRNRRVMFCLVTATVAQFASVVPAHADSIASYSIFAGHSIIGTSSMNAPSGVIGANGDLFLAGVTAQTVRAGGSFFDNFGSVNTTGDVTVNGNAQLTFFGDIGGNLNAGGSANLTADVAGNVLAGGSVTTTGDTAGSIFAGGAISAGSVGGTTNPFAVVNPPAFTPVALPAPHAFASGGASFTLDTFDSKTLTPGSYGELVMIGSNTVNLSSGDYHFSDVRMVGSFATFNFDTTNGPVNVFVTGSVFLVSASMNLNGVSVANVLPSDADQVYWETHDNFHVEFTDLLGTVYSPFGDIHVMKLSSVKGAIVAGGDIIAGGGSYSIGAISPSLLVPEPSGLALCLCAVVCLVLATARSRGIERTCQCRR